MKMMLQLLEVCQTLFRGDSPVIASSGGHATSGCVVFVSRIDSPGVSGICWDCCPSGWCSCSCCCGEDAWNTPWQVTGWNSIRWAWAWRTWARHRWTVACSLAEQDPEPPADAPSFSVSFRASSCNKHRQQTCLSTHLSTFSAMYRNESLTSLFQSWATQKLKTSHPKNFHEVFSRSIFRC